MRKNRGHGAVAPDGLGRSGSSPADGPSPARRPDDARARKSAENRAFLVLVALLVVVCGTYAAAVTIRRPGEASLAVDGVIGFLATWVPVAVAWFALSRVTGRRRPDLLFAVGALASWAAATTYYGLESFAGEVVPLPSPADVGYIGFYVLMLAALTVVVRMRLREMTWPVVLDSVVGALGAAAVLTVVLGPLLDPTIGGPPSPEAVLGAVYPLLDLLLIAVVVGMTATSGGLGKGWLVLVVGLSTVTGADIAYTLLALDEQYAVGTWLDAVWASGMALVALWVVLQARPVRHEVRRRARVPAQAVPASATIAGLGVLILASQQPVVLPAVVLASLTLALAALPLTFRQRLQLSQANRQARTDELTGLRNRRALYRDVPHRLLAHGDRPSAVLLLDLDRFKEINDGLGHDVGDLLLTQVAGRLAGQLRPSDLLARMGGDEFVVHVEQCGREQAEAVALALRTALAEPYDLGGVTVQVNASIGISCYPEQGGDLSLLLRKADMAMYTAKTAHTGYAVYSDGATELGAHRFHTVQALNDALVHHQLILHFQPKIDLATGSVRGVEALVRWQHPTLGLLQPEAFLKRFDEAGLLPALTDVVLEQVLDQAAVWAAAGRPLTVAVNLSASSIMDSRLPAQIAAMTSTRGLSPSVLVLEITEDVLISDRLRAAANLTELRAQGVRIAVDDFGAGYSSLSYLRELPIDELKLDKSFILTMLDDARATALVVSTIDLAHSLGLEMTAEGVEHTEAYRALSDYGCDLAQGYLMSRPVPAGELDLWLSNRTAPGPGSDLPGAALPDGDDACSMT